VEHCGVCGCELHRGGDYATPTIEGRSHASSHHHVPERFFGRSKNRSRVQRERLFEVSPWGLEGKAAVFCYDCHEELLHNPVVLPQDLGALAELVRLRGLEEPMKTKSRDKLAGRIRLFHEAFALGIEQMLERERQQRTGKTPARTDELWTSTRAQSLDGIEGVR
jgi:hypothetical protein